jgi:hypothetical protein
MKRLERTKFLARIVRFISFGTITLNDRVQALEREVFLSRQDLDECLLASKEYSDMKLYLALCDIQGTSVTGFRTQTPLTVQLCDYGPDWSDISLRVKQRDAFTCQKADGRCRGPLQAHHIVELSRGGTTTEDNLITLCEFHHSLKHLHLQGRI